jgi:hypothetical protein
MKVKSFFLTFLSVVCGCNALLTENEDKGINEALAFFGGQCEYSIGVSTTTKGENVKFFELELSKSTALTEYQAHKEMLASKLCHIFYSNLDERERENYTHLRGTLVYDNGEKFSKDYSMKDIEVVENKLRIVSNLISLLKKKNFVEISNLMNDDDVFMYDKESLVANMQELDPQFGGVTGFKFFGFNFSNAGNDQILKIYGVVLRDKSSHELSVYINPNSKTDQILKLDYKL